MRMEEKERGRTKKNYTEETRKYRAKKKLNRLVAVKGSLPPSKLCRRRQRLASSLKAFLYSAIAELSKALPPSSKVLRSRRLVTSQGFSALYLCRRTIAGSTIISL
ncbi:hypothetical protein VIGAN_11158800 [Vigna angularis var. angularis]|uniref:Uncharacterized protein n=1 Tax=Vigna angularis var. angularis TaxID=157739 RepID=A0A0S3TAZ5_PHAAN|nr:hypothetical protein VIGAN_11158800 [Vigna angularis var. angularis]